MSFDSFIITSEIFKYYKRVIIHGVLLNYNNEAFIKMTLAIMPNTILTDCSFEDCKIIVFDNSVQTNNCRFIGNNIIQVQRVL